MRCDFFAALHVWTLPTYVGTYHGKHAVFLESSQNSVAPSVEGGFLEIPNLMRSRGQLDGSTKASCKPHRSMDWFFWKKNGVANAKVKLLRSTKASWEWATASQSTASWVWPLGKYLSSPGELQGSQMGKSHASPGIFHSMSLHVDSF